MLNLAMVSGMEIEETAVAHQHEAALWVCSECRVWWGSQSSDHRDAHYLLHMAEPNTKLFLWEDYRGWRLQAEEANLCPDCGRGAPLPRFILLSQANGYGA
jgi:hypothetical protein